MRRLSRNTALFFYAIMLVLAAVSCTKEIDFGFKELCYYHPHTAPVKLSVDWSKFEHLEKPSGMSVYVWPQDSARKPYEQTTHKLDGITLNLLQGTYHSYVFNQSETEFATIEFANMHSFESAQVRVRQTKSSWYSTKEPTTKIGEEPEWFAVDCVKDILVTEEMVRVAEEEYLASIGKSARGGTRVNEIATLIPRSVIKNIDLFIHFKNITSLRSALGAMEGMAEGCYISSRQTTSSTVTHTINSWQLIRDTLKNGSSEQINGCLKVSVSTFGLPAGHTGTAEETNLYLKLMLVDNETELTHDFPLGELLADLNAYDGSFTDADGLIWPQIHLYWPEPLPDVRPQVGGNGGFDVGVSDWGDEIITIVPIL